MQLAIQPISELEVMANHIVKSGLFGLRKTEEAVALMLVAQAEGRHPGTVAAEYHIIQGRPALKADAILARFQTAGGKVEWHDHTNVKVSATFTHPAGGSLRIDWDIARAKEAGLGGKENWRKYPRQMLRARVISEGVRAVFPAVLQGFYTPEEVQDFASESPAPVAPAPAPAQKRRKAEKAEVVEAEIVEQVVEEPAPVAEEAVPAGLDWQEKLAANEIPVNAFLVARGQIEAGQTWRDIPAGEYLSRIASNVDKFVAAATSSK